jgi:branched-chain amino acid transport system permease protein
VNEALFNTVCIYAGFAFSQYVALRGGMFAISTAGFVSVGAYAAAIATKSWGAGPIAAIAFATLVTLAAGLVLAAPLARLQGHFQAIATLAFVEIVRSVALYAEPVTGGARGINGIPNTVGPVTLLGLVVVLLVMMAVLNRSGIGRAFDAIRQDDTVARSLGISVAFYQTLALVLSAGIAGISGAMLALSAYSISPEEFGFPMIVAAIGAVVLGGRNSVWGPVAGAAIIVLLPEAARPLADNRTLLYGAVLIATITYLPDGIADAIARWLGRLRRADPPVALPSIERHG